MQAKGSSRSESEWKDKSTQRAVLAVVLHEFPRQLTREALRWRGFGDSDALELAISNLASVGLLWPEGEVVLPTLPARHFDWLEMA